ncbi:MAG: selenocysteine-specific translation elongation factor [Bryobacteraceae bacterium]
MKNIIAGTAGHIDHGKTALVRALTGIDTDRLKEEKQRGISIDLGFAHLDLSQDLRLGFVDVPGHERFIKNMLAGVGGIDLVLFVIAADESIKPQTREHFDICRLLNITKGIVVLTKADLVDGDILELVRLEVDEFLRGSFLEHAPVIAVSSTTGAGLLELRAELLRQASGIREKNTSRYLRLPIDRAFSMRGFGTVVTGTLMSGILTPEQEVEVFPDRGRVRVRGIQVHGETVARATAGQRTAVNLAGADASELARGMTLAEPGRFSAVKRIDCWFELLASAKPLRNHAPIHFHAGTAEIEGNIRSLENKDAILSGSRSYARIDLRDPVLLLPGDRFIVRKFSPVVTIGGGVVLDIAPPRRDAAARLETLEHGSAKERLTLLVSESKFGTGLDQIIARTGLLESEIRSAAQTDELVVISQPQFWVMHGSWVKTKIESIQALLKKFHRDHPLLPGISKEELRSRELPGAPGFILDALLDRSKTISAKAETVHLASHKVALKQDEADAAAKIEKAFESSGLAVPSTPEVLAKSGVEPARGRTLLQILLREKKLVRISEDLIFHSTAIDALHALLATHKGQRFAVPEFKEWTGISRKYAIPLLEFLDRERITRREDDLRVVL